jgi:cytochrome P450
MTGEPATGVGDVDFALGGDIADLHGTLRALRERGPVVRVRYYDEPAWLFTTYDAVEAAYRDDDLFPAAAAFKELTEPVLGRNLQCMHGAEHRRNRMLVSPAFRARAMPEVVRPIIDDVAHEIVDRFAARGEAELVDEFDRVLPGVVITRLLGVPRDADAEFQRWAHDLLSFTADADRALAARDELTRYLAPLVEERRADPQDDLVSTLATTELDGEQLTDEEIFSFVRLVFAAGTDTTFFGLGNALAALLTHPDEHERVVADPALELPWAVEEVLRWESPVSMEPRRAPTATAWFGQPIDAGSRLLFGIAAANRDPARFDDPDRFDVGRRAQPIMTFGIGPHFCLGAHLARAELTGALAVLLDRLPGLRLADPDAARIAGTVLRGPDRLAVRFRPSRA